MRISSSDVFIPDDGNKHHVSILCDEDVVDVYVDGALVQRGTSHG